MPINYRPVSICDNMNEEETKKQKKYPKCVCNDVLNTEKLAKEICQTSMFSYAEAKMAIETVTHALLRALGNGNFVNIEGLGSFQPTARYISDEKAVETSRSQSVEVKGIAFRPSKEAKLVLSMAGFKKADERLIERKDYATPKRKSYLNK
ncbi:MAG: HU family DNA-binding protein [Bacteroidales bacterium]